MIRRILHLPTKENGSFILVAPVSDDNYDNSESIPALRLCRLPLVAAGGLTPCAAAALTPMPGRCSHHTRRPNLPQPPPVNMLSSLSSLMSSLPSVAEMCWLWMPASHCTLPAVSADAQAGGSKRSCPSPISGCALHGVNLRRPDPCPPSSGSPQHSAS